VPVLRHRHTLTYPRDLLARDVVAEPEAARLAWISALVGGAGIAAMFSAVDHLPRRRALKVPERETRELPGKPSAEIRQ
jgi:hypothetical protein